MLARRKLFCRIKNSFKNWPLQPILGSLNLQQQHFRCRKLGCFTNKKKTIWFNNVLGYLLFVSFYSAVIVKHVSKKGGANKVSPSLVDNFFNSCV
jgi:hypothetical protein